MTKNRSDIGVLFLFFINCIRSQTQEQTQFDELFKLITDFTNMSWFASHWRKNTCTLIYNRSDYNGGAVVDLFFFFMFFSLMIGLSGKYSPSVSDSHSAMNNGVQNLFFHGSFDFAYIYLRTAHHCRSDPLPSKALTR